MSSKLAQYCEWGYGSVFRQLDPVARDTDQQGGGDPAASAAHPAGRIMDFILLWGSHLFLPCLPSRDKLAGDVAFRLHQLI